MHLQLTKIKVSSSQGSHVYMYCLASFPDSSHSTPQLFIALYTIKSWGVESGNEAMYCLPSSTFTELCTSHTHTHISQVTLWKELPEGEWVCVSEVDKGQQVQEQQ